MATTEQESHFRPKLPIKAIKLVSSSSTSSSACSTTTSSSDEAKPGSKYRPRIGKPKVRSGCVVCKIRRVKCDEAKPACLRCTSTGRKCEGYTVPSPKLNKGGKPAPKLYDITEQGPGLDLAPTPVFSGLSGSISEKRSLYFFRLATESDISRYFGASFWDKLVLPAVEIYPTVRHSLLAVSTLYEAYVKREHISQRSQGVLDTPTSRSALLEYNKAVNILSNDLLRDKLPRQIVLICCILFVWLEFLRNDFATGLKHLKSGLFILQETRSSSAVISALSHVDESICHVFTRLQAQGSLHGCPLSDFTSTPMRCPTEASMIHLSQSFDQIHLSRPFDMIDLSQPFEHPVDFRNYLDYKLVHIFQLIRKKQVFERARGTEVATLTPEWFQFVAERDSHLADLERWHTVLTGSLYSPSPNESSSPGPLLLEVNYNMGSLMLKTLFTETEMEYDQYIADFEHILSLSERIVRPPPKGSPPIISFDVGVIPVLFYIIMKCRDTVIRHRAMDLLKRAPEREGIWHRDSVVTATTWKVAMEEQWISRHPGTSRPPEEARIYREQVVDANGEDEPARVHFEGGPVGSAEMEWEVRGLLSRLGDMI